MKQWFLKTAKRLVIKLLIVFLPLYLIFSTYSIVSQTNTVSPETTRVARDTIKKVWSQLSSNSDEIYIELSQKQLNEVAALTNYTLKNASTLINVSPVGVTAALSYKIDLPLKPIYFNVYCLLSPDYEGFQIDSCKMGSIPLFGWLVDFFVDTFIHLLFGSEASETYEKMLASIQIQDNKLLVKADKPIHLKEAIKSSLKDTTNLVRGLYSKGELDTDLIGIYIAHLSNIENRSNSLAVYLGEAFKLAKIRSRDSDPIEENRAAMWGLAAVFGTPRFAELVGLDRKTSGIKYKTLTLRGRDDLNLHFLYSIVLEQMGDAAMGLSVGEIKELLDSNRGGSGYSFADLAADKAGLKFSEFVVSSDSNAELAQNILSPLATSADESIFFPFIHDLPEGFRGNDFKKIIGNLESDTYKQLETEIDRRISKLPLFENSHVDYTQPSRQKVDEQSSEVKSSDNQGRWYKVDTHIHTKFSDGRNTVAQIADKAIEFGCDAIAITDHGDYNLKKVTSNEYFRTIEEVDLRFPSLTVMAGLEWNLPPFMGREHATVILPKSTNMSRNLNAFKEKFDSWGRRDENLLSAQGAFDWLNKYGNENSTNPIVFYNHPSRKDNNVEENYHDMMSWLAYSDDIIGMSGSPGHQKKRDHTNGSYETKHKTLNGWDPSVAKVGGEWDRLLQRGHMVWAARAPSDFHNTGMDYWPCQFSTTHVYAKSNEQNDILTAFRSGRFWAQHGRLVDDLSFSVTSTAGTVNMGSTMSTFRNDDLDIELLVILNSQDWQGNDVKLDEIEMIVIERDSIETVSLDPSQFDSAGLIYIKQSYMPKTDQVVIRFRGRSHQNEMHDYMFYTNPVRVNIRE